MRKKLMPSSATRPISGYFWYTSSSMSFTRSGFRRGDLADGLGGKDASNRHRDFSNLWRSVEDHDLSDGFSTREPVKAGV